MPTIPACMPGWLWFVNTISGTARELPRVSYKAVFTSLGKPLQYDAVLRSLTLLLAYPRSQALSHSGEVKPGIFCHVT